MSTSSARVVVVGACLLLAACDSNTSAKATTANGLEIDLYTTVDEALDARRDSSVDILFEMSVISVSAVSERMAKLRRAFEEERRNNSICFSVPGLLGKPASTCNSYDYDVLFLNLGDSQLISDKLSYYAEFAEEPLYAGLVAAVDTLKQVEIDQLVNICTRMVFKDAASHQLRNDIPIIVMIDPKDLSDQDKGVEKLLRRCLE